MKIPNLYELQHSFKKAVESEGEVNLQALNIEMSKAKAHGQIRFNVYRNAYWIRLIEALIEDFPEIKNLLGEDRFEEILKNYMKQMPSQHPSLSQISADLSHYFKTNPIPEFPYLHDLALLEWTTVLSGVTLEKAIDVTGFETLTDGWNDELIIVLNPTVKLLKTDWDVLNLQTCLQKGVGSFFYLVATVDGDTTTTQISTHEFEVLSRISKQMTLAELVSELTKIQTSPEALTENFAAWVSRGIFAGYRLKGKIL